MARRFCSNASVDFFRWTMERFWWMENRSGKRLKRRKYWRHHRDAGLSSGYSARQNLQFLAGIRRKIRKKEIDEAIRKVGLDPEAKSMSASIRSACASVSALHRRLWKNLLSLILDEPMNGLDNQGVQEMRQLFLKLKRGRKNDSSGQPQPGETSRHCAIRRWRLTGGKITKTRT